MTEFYISYLGVILSSVCTTRLLTSSCSGDGLDSALQEIAKLNGLYEITGTPGEYHATSYWLSILRVPDHAPVLDADVVIGLEDSSDICNTLVKG